MNVFVLCTGRCGSATFAQACTHIANYTSGHETRTGILGVERLGYASDHIEVDNRLTWKLGLLEERYGDEAFYVHLWRAPEATAASYARRWGRGVVRGYDEWVLRGRAQASPDATPQQICEDYCDSVDSAVRHFLRDKTHRLDFPLEQAEARFPEFWHAIGAEGDFEAGLAEWTRKWNDSAREQHYPPELRERRHAHYETPGAAGRALRWLARKRGRRPS